MKKIIVFFAIALISFSSFGQKLDNEFYFRFGYSNPSWEQFGLTDEFRGDEGLESKTGAIFELGTIFMINSLPASDKMAFGINVDYLYLNYNNFSTIDNEFNIGTMRVGSKIGPSFTFSPTKRLAFDIFAKVDIAWATATAFYENSIEDADETYIAKMATGFSTGLNIRFGILMIGLEYNTISPELESDDYPGEFIGNLSDENSNKSPLPSMNFTLGLSF
ncbi:MAG: outer membrane beta-barrel protein [Draconibacterium sp.]|nr:outer membrane beta-barrel protein [Draconibacterium sp.]